MEEKIDIWLVGNTGLRNPNRIQEGFKAFANSPYVGKLRGKENEIGFMNFLISGNLCFLLWENFWKKCITGAVFMG